MMKDISLIDFPTKFLPLVVVTGDRREDHPKTKGDLLAYSVSNIDMTFLFQLGLDRKTHIVSDKVFVLEEDEYLRKIFADINILTIGSPAVNLLTRKVNDSSLFYFDIPEEAKTDITKHEHVIDNIKFSPVELGIYQEIFKTGLTPDEIVSLGLLDFQDRDYIQRTCRELYDKYKSLNLSEENWKQLMHNFDRPGIFDPIDKRKHAVTTQDYNDFGLISIAYNPFSNDTTHYVITVAGIHGIGTAHGVKLLANQESFLERPFGGVYETQFPVFGSWSDRLQKAQVKWQTKPYKDRFPSINAALEIATSRASGLGKKFGFFISTPYDEDSIELVELNKNLEKICKKALSASKTAYSIQTSGKGTFPKVIEERIQDSSAIIHLMNGCNPGVLFEIGLSLGFKKHAFLIWDRSISPFRTASLPEVLRKINVISIDSSDESKLEEKVKSLIIGPSLDAQGDMLCLRSESKKCFIRDNLNEQPDSRLFLYVSKAYNRFRDMLTQVATNDFQCSPLDESELKGKGLLCSNCYGIVRASMSAFILDDRDKDGIVLLGIASALEKKAILLRKTALSMWEGDFYQISHASVEEDMKRGLYKLFDKYRSV